MMPASHVPASSVWMGMPFCCNANTPIQKELSWQCQMLALIVRQADSGSSDAHSDATVGNTTGQDRTRKYRSDLLLGPSEK